MKYMAQYGFIVLIAVLMLLLIRPVYADSPLPTPVARVIWIKGELKAVMPSKEERILQRSSVVYLKDTLITDDKSTAQIAFTDGTLMTFEPSSKFSVDTYSYNPKNKKGSAGQFVMRLVAGGFRTITGLITKDNPTHYGINTPVATVGVRGTDYRLAIKNGSVFLGYISGSPCITGNKDKSATCLDAQHQYVEVGSNGVGAMLAQRPAVFSKEVEITPAKISLFNNSNQSNNQNNNRSKNGTVSSFCISS